MKISSRSGSPIVVRISCRCVPSAQSKSRRWPPRRTSSAAGARDAVGVLADVPRKTRSRSIPPPSLAAAERDLRENEVLADADVGTSEMVGPLDAPDRVAYIATVVAL